MTTHQTYGIIVPRNQKLLGVEPMTDTPQNLEKTLYKLHHLTNKMNCANILIMQLEELITKSYYRGYYDGFKDGYDDGEKAFLIEKCGKCGKIDFH